MGLVFTSGAGRGGGGGGDEDNNISALSVSFIKGAVEKGMGMNFPLHVVMPRVKMR